MEISDVVRVALEAGKRLTADAVACIEEYSDLIDFARLVEEIRRAGDAFITADVVMRAVRRADAGELRHEVEVVFDAGRLAKPAGGVTEARDYFRDRLERLGREISGAYGISGAADVASTASRDDEQYVIGMVSGKSIRRDSVVLEVEDFTGRRPFLVPNEGHLLRLAQRIPLDSVVGLKVKCRRDKPPLVLDIYLPQLRPGASAPPTDVYAALTSDLHVGSGSFLEESFERLVDMLRGDVDDERMRYIVERTLYMVIAGDIVDGVGIYPRQEEELAITDPREQYREAYKLLSKLPSRVKVIVIPGNHDAVRRALPRPPIDRDYAPEFYSDDRFLMLGDPANVRLHGVNVFVFHGDSLNDVLSTTPGLSPTDVAEAMHVLLQVRHVAPTYGLQTRIVATPPDALVIPADANVLQAGHIHRVDVKRLVDKRAVIVNSGTWQAQTRYQREMGVEPTPAVVPFLNLRTLHVTLLDLSS